MTLYAIKFKQLPKSQKKGKLTLKKGRYYTLLEGETELLQAELVGKLTFELRECDEEKRVLFKDIDIDSSCHSLESLIQEDIIKSTATIDFDDASALQELAEQVSHQFDAEKSDNELIKQRVTELNQSFFHSILPKKRETKKKEEPVVFPVSSYEEVEVEEPSFDTPPSEASPTSHDDLPQEIVFDDYGREEVEGITEVAETAEIPVTVTPPPIVSALTIDQYSQLPVTDSEEQTQALLTELSHKEQTDLAELCAYLGLDEQTQDRLTQKKIAYLNQIRAPHYYSDLKLKLEQTLINLKSECRQRLETEYLSSGLTEDSMQSFVASKLKVVELKVKKEQADAFHVYESELQATHEGEKQALKRKQHDELTEIQSRHKVEMANLSESLEATYREQVSTHKDYVSRQIDQTLTQEKQLIESQRRSEVETQLTMAKKGFLSKQDEFFLEECEKVAQSIQVRFQELKQAITDKEPEFRLEVKEEEEKKQKQAEWELTKEAQELDKRRVALLEQEAKQKQAQAEAQKELLLSQQQAVLASLQQPVKPEEKAGTDYEALVKLLSTQQLMKSEEPTRPQSSVLLKSVSALCLVSVIGMLYFGVQTYQAKASTDSLMTTLTSQSLDQEKETASLTAKNTDLEEQVGALSSTMSEKEKSYEALMSVKKFEDAASQYPEKIDAIEDAIFHSQEKETLKAFNSRHKSVLGELDVAILDADYPKIVQEYDALASKKELSNTRKLAIASAYYQVGEWEVGNKLLNE